MPDPETFAINLWPEVVVSDQSIFPVHFPIRVLAPTKMLLCWLFWFSQRRSRGVRKSSVVWHVSQVWPKAPEWTSSALWQPMQVRGALMRPEDGAEWHA